LLFSAVAAAPSRSVVDASARSSSTRVAALPKVAASSDEVSAVGLLTSSAGNGTLPRAEAPDCDSKDVDVNDVALNEPSATVRSASVLPAGEE
jgi:hypothetical protein